MGGRARQQDVSPGRAGYQGGRAWKPSVGEACPRTWHAATAFPSARACHVQRAKVRQNRWKESRRGERTQDETGVGVETDHGPRKQIGWGQRWTTFLCMLAALADSPERGGSRTSSCFEVVVVVLLIMPRAGSICRWQRAGAARMRPQTWHSTSCQHKQSPPASSHHDTSLPAQTTTICETALRTAAFVAQHPASHSSLHTSLHDNS